MNKTFLSLALIAAGGLSLFGTKVEAMPIHSFSLSDASSQSSYTYSWLLGDPTNESLTLSGWEYDPTVTGGNAWTPAVMLYKSQGPGETGLGVQCNPGAPSGNACGQNEIGTTPWQIINVDLSGLSGYNRITIGAASVNTTVGGLSPDETAYLYGATCNPGANNGTGCTPTLLDSFTFGQPSNSSPSDTYVWTLSLTSLEQAGWTNLWLTPNAWGTTPMGDGNILLYGGANGFSVSVVPEPAALGMFGLGVLLIGLFGGLKRRKS